MDTYETGSYPVTVADAATGRRIGYVNVQWEHIGNTWCPTCLLDSVAVVVVHSPCGPRIWTNCDQCSDDTSNA